MASVSFQILIRSREKFRRNRTGLSGLLERSSFSFESLRYDSRSIKMRRPFEKISQKGDRRNAAGSSLRSREFSIGEKQWRYPSAFRSFSRFKNRVVQNETRTKKDYSKIKMSFPVSVDFVMRKHWFCCNFSRMSHNRDILLYLKARKHEQRRKSK